MAKIYLGLGSNVDPHKYLRLGIRELGLHFGVLELSNVYRSKAVGFEGEDFLNLVVGLETEMSPLEIHEVIEKMHVVAGRQRGESRYSPRTLDVDLLLYDDLVLSEPPLSLPRVDVLKYSFVLGPLAEIAPELRHPETGKLITEHWAEFDKNSHPLAAADLEIVD
ncbi:MAG: 2-amino-4-hydroxy-6-hydroxymethyldihydropteridine diphosphokinase [Woeseiaceae bacterium]